MQVAQVLNITHVHCTCPCYMHSVCRMMYGVCRELYFDNNLPKLDEAGSSQKCTHCPLGNLTAVVLQLSS